MLSLLPVLVLLELILSADNAVALAAIARSSRQAEQERLALNIGIGLAMVLRIGLIALAQWVLRNSWVQLLAAAYLFWLFISHLIERNSAGEDGDPSVEDSPKRNLFQTVVLLGLTDLAFSIDSVAAAVAVSDRIGLVITGGVVGVVALRLSSGLFIRLLQRYQRLEAAGYLAVGLVGIQLSVRVFRPDLELPEWGLLVLVGLLFLWGFSAQQPEAEEVQP